MAKIKILYNIKIMEIDDKVYAVYRNPLTDNGYLMVPVDMSLENACKVVDGDDLYEEIDKKFVGEVKVFNNAKVIQSHGNTYVVYPNPISSNALIMNSLNLSVERSYTLCKGDNKFEEIEEALSNGTI